MGITIVWDDADKTIIRHIYEGDWTVEDYYNLILDHNQEISSLDYPVAVINDLRAAGPIPPNMGSAIKYAARIAPLNEEIKLVVGGERTVKAFVDLVNSTAGSDVTEMFYVDTMEEAYALIAQHRTPKPVSKPTSSEQPAVSQD